MHFGFYQKLKTKIMSHYHMYQVVVVVMLMIVLVMVTVAQNHGLVMDTRIVKINLKNVI